MYIYHCELNKRRAGFAPSPTITITILAPTFEEASLKAKEYKNKHIHRVTAIISIQRGDKIDIS